ncbi:MAG: DUF4230 domain-containing protein [Verrucomicrobia bacterium]|nr:DUF4230 domain-containing protein [Verrucomicrobiota bacterium]
MRTLLGYLCAAAVGALAVLLWLRQPVQREINNDFAITEIKRVAKAFAAEQVVAFNYTHKRSDVVSTAQVSIFGKARAFAGFDLVKHLRVNVDQAKKRVLVELAQPEILGVDVFDQTYQYEKDWPWNRFSEEDRDAVARGLRQGVLNDAKAGPLLREARESIKDFLTAMFGVHGYAVTVEFSGPETAPPPKG